MHVLMTADAVGGVWTYALDLAAALGPHAVRVSLAVLGPSPSTAQRAGAAALPHVTLHEHPCRLEWMDDPWHDVDTSGQWLLALEDALAPDVVHLNGYAHASLPWRAPVVVAGHSCVLSWWKAVHAEDAPRQYERYADAVNRGLAAADVVVAPTASMLRMLETEYGPLREARVILNGRRQEAPAPAVKEPFVLTAGRLWDEAKNVAAVAAVAPLLRWPVYVAGDRRSPDGTVAALPGVRHLGVLPPSELASWMTRASIFALPARYEPFGLCPLEAALAGCALVLGDIRSLREVWGDAAVYVPPGDRAALASALQVLIASPAARASAATRARARAGQLTADAMASQYLDVYAESAVRRGTGARSTRLQPV